MSAWKLARTTPSIGAFTIAVILAGFGTVLWLSGGSSRQVSQLVRIVFSGSVGGLSRGSSVNFNGIKVGEVTDIRLAPQDPRRVLATIKVDPATPLRADTRARLDSAMLTGVSVISLSGGNADAPVLTPMANGEPPTIFADSSDMQDMMALARQVAQRADDMLARLDRLVSANEGRSTGRSPMSRPSRRRWPMPARTSPRWSRPWTGPSSAG